MGMSAAISPQSYSRPGHLHYSLFLGANYSHEFLASALFFPPQAVTSAILFLL